MEQLYQIHPTKIIFIGNIINDCFESLKFYLFRLEYSLNDYERQRIKWSYQTFRRTIWLTLNSWINIFFNIHLALFPSNFLIKLFQSFEQLLHFERIDLLLQLQIFTFIILEYPWFIFFKKILHYNFRINNLFYKYHYHFDDYQLEIEYRLYLIRLINIGDFITRTLNIVMAIVLSISGIFGITIFIFLYFNNDITIVLMIIYIPLLINLLLRSYYLVGQLFNIIKYVLFLIELLKLQIKQIILYLQLKIRCYRFNLSIYGRFLHGYNKLNNDVFILNQTISNVFFSIETMSKVTVIYCSIFFSKQNEMNLFNTIIVIYFISLFIYTNGLYSRAAQLPHYNRCGCLSIMNWLARLQYQKYYGHSYRPSRLYRSSRLSICNQIRSNFFAQSISENHLGFSCGQMFPIIKYKYVEMFLMNFVLVILFYKKICLA